LLYQKYLDKKEDPDATIAGECSSPNGRFEGDSAIFLPLASVELYEMFGGINMLQSELSSSESSSSESSSSEFSRPMTF
jgi:hypothetical protein